MTEDGATVNDRRIITAIDRDEKEINVADRLM